jgi:hypothetical protein
MSLASAIPDKTIAGRDYILATLLGMLIAGFHYYNGYPLAKSVLLQSFNWAFDLDSSRFVKAWTVPDADVSDVLPVSFVARHALSLAIRPLGLGFNMVIGDSYLAVMALTALCAGCVTVIAYFLAAQLCESRFDRLLIAAGYSFSAQPLMLGVNPETYGFALAGIGLHMVMVVNRRGLPPAVTGWSVVAFILNAGMTVTNAVLNLVASALLAWKRLTLLNWLATELKTGMFAALGLVVIVVPLAALFEPTVLANATSAPKQLWWIININRGEAAFLPAVIAALVPYGFVAPEFTMVNLPDDGHLMLDFREFRYGPAGGVAIAAWFVTMAAGVHAALRDDTLRRILLIVLLWTLLNVVLHWYWQFRGSIYLYGAHTSFPLLVLLIIGYASAIRRFSPVMVRAVAATMLSLAALSNFSLYKGMIDFIIAQPPVPEHMRTPSK